MLNMAFRQHSLSQTADFEWYSRFKAGWVSVEHNERSGWPSTSKTKESVGKIKEFIHEDHHQTIHELADIAGIIYGLLLWHSEMPERKCAVKKTEIWCNHNLLQLDNAPTHTSLKNHSVCH
jgi:hypothetical protein